MEFMISVRTLFHPGLLRPAVVHKDTLRQRYGKAGQAGPTTMAFCSTWFRSCFVVVWYWIDRTSWYLARSTDEICAATSASLDHGAVALLQFFMHVVRPLVVQDEGLMRSGIWLVERGTERITWSFDFKSSSAPPCSCCRLSLGKCL